VRALFRTVLAVTLVLVVTGCTGSGPATPAVSDGAEGPDGDAASTRSNGSVRAASPEVGECRRLTAEDVEAPDDDSPTVPCAGPHTAETFAVGEFSGRLAEVAVDDERLSDQVLGSCDRRFRRYVGADASLALRTVLSWAWFRPSAADWDAGARWYRCDLLGSGVEGLLELEGHARGVLLGRPADRWLLCAAGERVSDAPRVPCDRPHSWRAVTTVVLDDAAAAWPGADRVEARTRDFCSDSVGAWLGYPLDYTFGYTWLGRADWQTGNRRSVCWAETDR
jgi:hypothetical protein